MSKVKYRLNPAAKHLKQELEKLSRMFCLYRKYNKILIQAENVTELVKNTCDAITEVSPYGFAWVGFTSGNEGGGFIPVARSGKKNAEFLLIAQKALKGKPSSKPIVSTGEDAGKSSSGRKSVSSIALPLMDHDCCFGILSISSEEPGIFDENEVELLTKIADDLAYGITALRIRSEFKRTEKELQRILQSYKESLENMINEIASTVEERDPFTAGHQKRVTELAVAISKDLKLGEDIQEGIHMAGIIHDIGKISIPAEILSKTSHLNDEEIEIIRTHPRVGSDILAAGEFPWPVRDIIFQHHEKMNGSGYPAGITGKKLRPEAKILIVADVVEAMSSNRSHRPAQGIHKALEEISLHQGSYYDARAVESCIRLFQEKSFHFSQ